LFLFGAAGNGKPASPSASPGFAQFFWIRPSASTARSPPLAPPPRKYRWKAGGLLNKMPLDQRWIRIRRPTVVVGGELTMDNLEVTFNTSTGISEAPMPVEEQLRHAGDRRLRAAADEHRRLLNRWIVPLEKRHDYLNLANGKKIPGAVRSA